MFRSRVIRDTFAALAALLIVSAVSLAQAQEFAPGEVLVKFRAGPFSGNLATAIIGARQVSVVDGVDVSRVRLPAGMSVRAAVAYFRSLPNVEFAEENAIFHLVDIPNDQYFSTQWHLAKIQAPAAWDITMGSDTVRVAVLDSGVDFTHPDLAGKVVLAEDLTEIDGTNDVNDYNGHGTVTAGAVAAYTNNSIGIASIGRNTSLMIGKVSGDDGLLYLSELADGIGWATANGAQVISMSLAYWKAYTTLKNAVNNAWNAGVVLVAGAGNTGDTKVQYPASYPNCIGVAATDQNDAKTGFSTYGSWVDCAAPGVSILTTRIGGTYTSASGTSLSCPLVAGLAALVWARFPGSTNAEIRQKVETTGVTVTNGFGRYPTKRINALAAVQ